MELVLGLPYLMCLPFEIETTQYLFFKKSTHRWIAMNGKTLSLLDEFYRPLWTINGTFNHDISWDPKNLLIWAIMEDFQKIEGKTYSFFSVHAYNLKGEEVGTWRSYDHLEKLHKIGYWKIVDGISYPLTARHKVRDTVLMANYMKWQKKPWKSAGGAQIPEGSLILNIRYLNVMVAFDKNFNIIWHYQFNPNPRDSVHFDIHTPILMDNGDIIAFVNSIDKGGHKRSGVYRFDSDKEASAKEIYLVPQLYKQQEERPGSFGSVQHIKKDNSLFISTGSEFGGIIHLSKDNQVYFEWRNPKLSNDYDGHQVDPYPQPIYRAELVDPKWLPVLSN